MLCSMETQQPAMHYKQAGFENIPDGIVSRHAFLGFAVGTVASPGSFVAARQQNFPI